jgi:hypothetical protein
MVARLAPWTPVLAQRLGVALGARNADRSHARAAPGRIAAGQRFFTLTVAADPTAQAEPMPTPADAGPRTTVPPALQAALSPRLPREQAIAQLQHAQTPGWWQRWRQRVKHLRTHELAEATGRPQSGRATVGRAAATAWPERFARA